MIIGLDIGYRFTKATAPDAPLVALPSVVAPYEGGFADDFTASGGRPLTFEGRMWLVGNDALYSRLPRRTLDRTRTGSDEYVLLALKALTCLLPEGHTNLHLVTGLPNADLSDQAAVEAALTGRFKVEVGGNKLTYVVKAVKVLPQALGTLSGEILTSNGAGVKLVNSDLPRQTILTVDFGGLTINFQKFREQRFIAHESGSIQTGIVTILTQLQAAIQVEHGRKLTLDETDQALRQGFLTNYGGKLQDITVLSQPIVRGVAETAVAFARSLGWSDGRDAPHLLLTGGGAYHVGPEFSSLYGHPGARLVAQPEFANVKGYLLYGLGLKAQKRW